MGTDWEQGLESANFPYSDHEAGASEMWVPKLELGNQCVFLLF